MIRLRAEKANLDVVSRETLTSGAVQVYRVQVELDEAWAGLRTGAVFRAGAAGQPLEVLLEEDGGCCIPWEALEERNAGQHLYVGLYGVGESQRVLPTTWADLGMICRGVGGGEETRPPTLDLYQQILGEAEQARRLAQSVREDADSGKFTGRDGAQGVGIAQGGRAGEVLVKNSDRDFDTGWSTVGAGEAQVLAVLSGLGLLPAALSREAVLTNGGKNIILWR